MSGSPPGVQVNPRAPHGRSRLALDIERVLDVRRRQTIRAEFRFDPETPLTVRVELGIEGGRSVVWRIGRDLLRQGLSAMSGLGDVQIWPTGPAPRHTARLQLVSGDMAALFDLPVPPLAAFLEHTYEWVPAGRELAHLDWDATATDLLDGPGAPSD
ncbi:SsgA family sporulation/cell division regulator [Streptomyces sp. NPDC052225]|uniref:SsgA family sporulation/cell division regulator n=1 Tax=Streptomyces sp. NPDC052225 TaxID=3154949 RepID=UPI003431A5CA